MVKRQERAADDGSRRLHALTHGYKHLDVGGAEEDLGSDGDEDEREHGVDRVKVGEGGGDHKVDRAEKQHRETLARHHQSRVRRGA